MTRTLLRACLDCGKAVRGKPRCSDCQRPRDQAKDQAKQARRPDKNRNAEIERRRRAVAYWRATVGDWCPGVPRLRRPAHPAANLTVDHLVEVAAGGLESGPLIVRCGPCNSARSANVTRAFLTMGDPTPPSPGEVGDSHLGGGPVVA